MSGLLRGPQAPRRQSPLRFAARSFPRRPPACVLDRRSTALNRETRWA
jgi:hypothetical protein